MRIALSLAVAATAAAAVCASASSASAPPQLTSFSVAKVSRNATGLRLTAAGTIDCTAGAHYHLWLWVYQSGQGALGHALVPKSSSKARKRKPVRACKGSVQHWKTRLKAEGRHPAHFVAGPAQVCTSLAISHARRYAFQQSCVSVTIG